MIKTISWHLTQVINAKVFVQERGQLTANILTVIIGIVQNVSLILRRRLYFVPAVVRL